MSSKPIEYCDIVMKGGITSGIVYPNAVLALAKRYTFKNIGGTSAGAIAAAALAAAALGERRLHLRPDVITADEKEIGFRGLKAVADQLKKPGFILSLFQAAAGTRRAFGMILKLNRNPPALAKALAVASAIFMLAPVTTALCALLLFGLAWVAGGALALAVTFIPSLVFTLVLGGIVGLRFLATEMRVNNLGICSGRGVNQGGQKVDGLTDWLHSVIQSLSGQVDRPLIFEDLWDAPPYPDEPGKNRLSLEMITTGISHHEPRRLPFEDSHFWFRRDQFLKLFPEDVVDWMEAQDPAPLTISGTTYYQLPEKGQLPVIVSTRMSLSFPLLLSAVPLYEGVWKSASRTSPAVVKAGQEARSLSQSSDSLAVGGRRTSRRPEQVRICWFSDGGIGSNFPIHLFDAPLPRWPTFAIDLVYPNTSQSTAKKSVFLPTENNQGWQRRYSSIAAPGAISEIASFLFGIVGTMQNWRDVLQSRAPGHRDRIISIALAGDEGGMNLDMPKDVLDRIADKGTQAGQILVDDFDFNNHWWIRWRNAASAVERFTIGFASTASAAPTAAYKDAWSSARTGTPPAPSYVFSAAQQGEAAHRFEQIKQDGNLWEDTVAELTKGAPKPLPQLRIVPTF